MAATIQITVTNGTSPGTDNNAEAGVVFGRDDLVSSLTSVMKPSSAGTARSFYKLFSTKVTAGGGLTSIKDRGVRWASAPAAGLTGWLLTASPSAYTQATSGNAPADDASVNDSTPAGWTALTTAFQVYDAASVAAANGSRNGKFCQIALGASNLYLGGANPSATLPNIEFQWTEQ